MAVDIDTILRLKAEGATKVVLRADGSLEVEFAAPMPATQDHQDDSPDPRKTYPRRPTGGLVTRGEDGDSRSA